MQIKNEIKNKEIKYPKKITVKKNPIRKKLIIIIIGMIINQIIMEILMRKYIL